MVLQRAPARATVWGSHAVPGTRVSVSLHGQRHNASVSASGVWRVVLPPMNASVEPATLHVDSDDGGNATLRDVVIGDVFLCACVWRLQPAPPFAVRYTLARMPHAVLAAGSRICSWACVRASRAS